MIEIIVFNNELGFLDHANAFGGFLRYLQYPGVIAKENYEDYKKLKPEIDRLIIYES